MTRTQQAVTLREQGLNNSQIAKAMGTYTANVQALLWHADNLERSRQNNRDTQQRRRLAKIDMPVSAVSDDIRQWWRARGY